MSEITTRPAHEDSRERRERYTCHIEVVLKETDDECEATATLTAPRETFAATGSSHRHPDDPSVPLIGEELAIGRALEALGKQLQAEAMQAVEEEESRPIHLVEVS